jgi:hypothetical protein
MGHTIIGIFRHSGDADLVAAHLRDEYALADSELDVIGEGDRERLRRPLTGEAVDWLVASMTGIGLSADPGPEEPIVKRWGDRLHAGETLVVARANDPEIANAIAGDMRRTGADRVDLLPH